MEAHHPRPPPMTRMLKRHPYYWLYTKYMHARIISRDSVERGVVNAKSFNLAPMEYMQLATQFNVLNLVPRYTRVSIQMYPYN